MEVKEILPAVGIILTFAALVKGIYDYFKAQKWTKAEFIAKEMKEFFSDFEVKRSLWMLDWKNIDIPLKENEAKDIKSIHFNDDLLISALKYHKEKSGFSTEEAIIRLTFDDFLSKISVFNQYVDADLITIKDIYPYLKYWIGILNNLGVCRKPDNVLKQIWIFINEYGYSDVKELCERFKKYEDEKVKVA